jgi:hypothetical protein
MTYKLLHVGKFFEFILAQNLFVASAVGAGTPSRFGPTPPKIMRLIATPATQHC